MCDVNSRESRMNVLRHMCELGQAYARLGHIKDAYRVANTIQQRFGKHYMKIKQKYCSE